MTAKKSTSTGNTTLYRGTYSDPDATTLTTIADEILQMYSQDTDYLYTIKNISGNGDKRLYYTDTNSNVLKDLLYYSRWWKEY
ncbi:MAG: hypothetical protein JXB48_17165 [Candidatus Latescibacteria bacterium]|nr:hypothetical protein [Candidatus Latescibacterota bacterium]